MDECGIKRISRFHSGYNHGNVVRGCRHKGYTCGLSTMGRLRVDDFLLSSYEELYLLFNGEHALPCGFVSLEKMVRLLGG